MPTWVARIVLSRVALGSGWDRSRTGHLRSPGEGWPLFDVLADVELGAGVGVGHVVSNTPDFEDGNLVRVEVDCDWSHSGR